VTRFGIQLHGSFPMGAYADLARSVERHSFVELTVHDVIWWRPVWPILTLLAAATERVAVGPDVTHPYLRHAVVTASNLAALDELSRGRAILGVGRGSLLEPLGISRRGSEKAVRRLVEEVGRFLAGTHEQANFLWRPPRARVPVFVGAFGPRIVETAAGWAAEIRPPGTWDTAVFSDRKERVGGRVRLHLFYDVRRVFRTQRFDERLLKLRIDLFDRVGVDFFVQGFADSFSLRGSKVLENVRDVRGVQLDNLS